MSEFTFKAQFKEKTVQNVRVNTDDNLVIRLDWEPPVFSGAKVIEYKVTNLVSGETDYTNQLSYSFNRNKKDMN